eukprot:TRINITY_DN905_c0_g1_i2.p1 TRINITY_DN905_c0_g1~~TRINITY_DN905_c0_g1_i2.p1  ORF type:complete len:763 (-),score=195.02 TRINITY_DN905_c0_g1_i2:7-2295(-)
MCAAVNGEAWRPSLPGSPLLKDVLSNTNRFLTTDPVGQRAASAAAAAREPAPRSSVGLRARGYPPAKGSGSRGGGRGRSGNVKGGGGRGDQRGRGGGRGSGGRGGAPAGRTASARRSVGSSSPARQQPSRARSQPVSENRRASVSADRQSSRPRAEASKSSPASAPRLWRPGSGPGAATPERPATAAASARGARPAAAADLPAPRRAGSANGGVRASARARSNSREQVSAGEGRERKSASAESAPTSNEGAARRVWCAGAARGSRRSGEPPGLSPPKRGARHDDEETVDAVEEIVAYDTIPLPAEAGQWPPSFADDLNTLARKFDVACDSSPSGLALRGSAAAMEAAKVELRELLKFYRKGQAEEQRQQVSVAASASASASSRASPEKEPRRRWAPAGAPAGAQVSGHNAACKENGGHVEEMERASTDEGHEEPAAPVEDPAKVESTEEITVSSDALCTEEAAGAQESANTINADQAVDIEDAGVEDREGDEEEEADADQAVDTEDAGVEDREGDEEEEADDAEADASHVSVASQDKELDLGGEREVEDSKDDEAVINDDETRATPDDADLHDDIANEHVTSNGETQVEDTCEKDDIDESHEENEAEKGTLQSDKGSESADAEVRLEREDGNSELNNGHGGVDHEEEHAPAEKDECEKTNANIGDADAVPDDADDGAHGTVVKEPMSRSGSTPSSPKTGSAPAADVELQGVLDQRRTHSEEHVFENAPAPCAADYASSDGRVESVSVAARDAEDGAGSDACG